MEAKKTATKIFPTRPKKKKGVGNSGKEWLSQKICAAKPHFPSRFTGTSW